MPNRKARLKTLLRFILVMAIMLASANAQCESYEFLDIGCIQCNEVHPGCDTCDLNEWFSCMDGLYYVPDLKYCTYEAMDGYYLDHNTRESYPCGDNCEHWVDDLGWVDWLQSTSSAQSFFASASGSTVTWDACSTTLPNCLLCSDSSTCVVRDSETLASGVAWDDSNCRVCETDQATCDYCKEGFVLSVGGWETKTWAVENCMDWADSVTTTWDMCSKGYFLAATADACTACPSNWAECSDESTCTLCESGFILSSTGTCETSCPSSEQLSLERVDPPVHDIFEKYSCVVPTCDSTCEACLDGDSSSDKCISWPLGKYFTVTDSVKMTGTCSDKSVKGDNEEIIIYVSNLSADISQAEADQTGDAATPYSDLMKAISSASKKAAVYSENSDGSIVTVRIALFTGDHFVIHKDYDWSLELDQIDTKSKHFRIHISPYFCSLNSTADSSHCLASETDTVNVYVKIGQNFMFELPESFIFENVALDFTDSMIRADDDPGNCLSSRVQCWVLNSQADGFDKFDSGQTEECTLRRVPRSARHYMNTNHMFYFPNIDEANNGISDPPELKFIGSSIRNIYFEFKSMIMIRNAGHLTFENSLMEHISSRGTIISDFYYEIDSTISYFKPGYIEQINVKPEIVELTTGWATTYSCMDINIQNSEFKNFFTLTPLITYKSTGFVEFTSQSSFLQVYDVNGRVDIQNSLFSNIYERTTRLGGSCNTQSLLTNVTNSVSYSSFFMLVSSQFELIMIQNTFEDISALSTVFQFTSSDITYQPTVELPPKKKVIVGNTFTRISAFGTATAMISASSGIPANIDDITTTEFMPCSRIIFAYNDISYVAAAQGATSSFSWQGFSLTAEQYSSLSFENPYSDYTITINTSLTDHVETTLSFDLNIVHITNNKIENVVSQSGGMFGLSTLLRVKISDNQVRYFGFNNVNLFKLSNLVSDETLTTCTAAEIDFDGGFSVNRGAFSILRTVELDVISNTFEDPWYYQMVDLDSNDNTVVFSFRESYGNITVQNTYMRGFTGVLGDYNTNTLNLSQSLSLTFDVDGLKAQRLMLVSTDSAIKNFLITNFTLENWHIESSSITVSSFILDIERSGSNVPVAQNFEMTDIWLNDITCYDSWYLLKLSTPATISNLTCVSLNQNTTYVNPYSSIMSCLDIETKLDEVITVNGMTVLDSKADSDPVAINIQQSSISATLANPYNVIIRGLELEHQNFENAPVLVNSAGSKVNFDGVKFENNTITETSNTFIQFSSVTEVTIENSFFTNNTGVIGNDMYFSGSTSSITISGTTFTGIGKDNIVDFDYSFRPAIYIIESSGILFRNCTFSNYANVDSGSVAYISGSTLTFEECLFDNNHANIASLSLFGTSDVTFTDVNMTNNEATESACLFLADQSTLTTTNWVFQDNLAERSTVFQATLDSIILDNSSLMTGNRATITNSVGLFSGTSGSIFDGTNITYNTLVPGEGNEGNCINFVSSEVTFQNAVIGWNYGEHQIKNLYGLLSTLNLDTVTFEDDPTLYTDSIIERGTGGFIYLSDSTLNVQNSDFNSGVAGQGGAIYGVSSTLIIEESRFNSNEASLNGGAIATVLCFDVSITNTNFTDNLSKIGDSLNIAQTQGILTVQGSSFISSFSPSFIHILESDSHVDDCVFEQTDQNDYTSLSQAQLSSLRAASAFAIEGIPLITIENCVFKNLLMSYGVIVIRDLETSSSQGLVQYQISSNTFENNTAYANLGASGIHIINPKNANITSNTFTRNHAVNGDGGGVKISCTTLFWVSNIQSNTFEHNSVATKGGAISWNLVEPTNAQDNTFVNNTASVYGNNIGSVGSSLEVITQAEYNANVNTSGDVQTVRRSLQSTSLSGQQSGSPIDTVYLAIKDTYGNIVKYGNTNYIQTSVTFDNSDGFTAALTGQTSYLPRNGVAAIDNLILTSAPGTNQTVSFISDDLVDSSSSLNMQIGVRACIAGEQLTGGGACQTCVGPSFYSIEVPSSVTTCLECPTSAICLGGSEIYPATNFWRHSNETDDFQICYIDGSCKGYDEATLNPLGECAEGYQGIKCGDWEPGYSRVNEFEWGKCPNLAVNIVISVLLFIVFVVFLIIIIAFTLNSSANSKNKFKLNVLLRVILNHIQMMAICVSFELNWPDSIDRLLGSATPVANIGTRFISIDCFIDQRDNSEDENSLALLLVRLIIYFNLPIVMIIIAVLIWNIKYLFEKSGLSRRINEDIVKIKKLQRKRDSKVITTIIVIMFVIYPSVVKGIFDVFLCDSVAGDQILAKETTVE